MEDRQGHHTWPLRGETTFHHNYDDLLSELRSARPSIYIELQLCASGVLRPDPHGTEGSIHHSRRISQESSERTNLLYSCTHCKGDCLHLLLEDWSHRCHILPRTYTQNLFCILLWGQDQGEDRQIQRLLLCGHTKTHQQSLYVYIKKISKCRHTAFDRYWHRKKGRDRSLPE